MTKDEKEDISKKANDVADAIERLASAMNKHYVASVERGEVIAEDVLPGWAFENDIERFRDIAKIIGEAQTWAKRDAN